MNSNNYDTNWYDLKDSFLLELKDNLLEQLIHKGKKKAGNLNLLCKELNFSAPTFYNLVNKKGVKMVSILKLKRLLDYLNISYNYINDKIKMTKKGKVISITNPIFPIDLNNKWGAYLLGLIVSDGCIYVDKKARNQIRTKYAAGEEQSAENFIQAITVLYGTVCIQKEFIRNCIILRIGTSIIGDSLLKAGAILGQKAAKNGSVPWIVKQGSKEMKANYLKAAFDDESSVYKEKERKCGYIIISRYKHLTHLTNEQREKLDSLNPLMKNRSFPTGHITRYMTIKKSLEYIKDKELIQQLNEPPNLLQDEASFLNEFGIRNRFFCRCLTKTHLGKYSVCYDLFINQKESIKKFYKDIGYSLTRKQEKLKLLVGDINCDEDL